MRHTHTDSEDIGRLLWGLTRTRRGSTLTEEDQDGADPLHGGHDVPEQEDGAEDGEELPGGGDDGAGQRPEVHHRHEDEGLEQITTIKSE